jgi:hypothetical protein
MKKTISRESMHKAFSRAWRIFNAMKDGVSTKYYTYIQGRTTTIRLLNAMCDNCMDKPILIVIGVLVVISAKAYNDSQNEKLTNPAKTLEYFTKAKERKAKAIKASTTKTMEGDDVADESPEEKKGG